MLHGTAIPSKIEWDLTNGGPKLIARAVRYSGLGVRSVGPVGDLIDTCSIVFFCCPHCSAYG